jgi:hypothetical protein
MRSIRKLNGCLLGNESSHVIKGYLPIAFVCQGVTLSKAFLFVSRDVACLSLEAATGQNKKRTENAFELMNRQY